MSTMSARVVPFVVLADAQAGAVSSNSDGARPGLRRRASTLQNKRWKVTAEAQVLLHELGSKKVNVVAVIGPERNGKSYLLNYLSHGENVGQLGDDQRFTVAASLNAVTKGLWLSVAPDLSTDPTGRTVTLAIDSEGIGGVGADSEPDVESLDHQIMGLGVLLSNLLIYNVKGNLERDSLQVLDTVTSILDLVTTGRASDAAARAKSNAEKLAQFQKTRESLAAMPEMLLMLETKEREWRDSQQQLAATEMQQLSAYLPRLVLSCRNFDLDLEQLRSLIELAPGESPSGTRYLEFKLRQEVVQAGRRVPKLNQLKERIKSLFPHRSCFTLPPPAAGHQQIHTMPLSDLDPGFVQELRALKAQVLRDLESGGPKSVRNARGAALQLSALDYAAFTQHILALINSHSGQFEIDSSYDMMRKSKMHDAVQAAVAAFSKEADALAAADTFTKTDVAAAVCELCTAAFASLSAAVQDDVTLDAQGLQEFVQEAAHFGSSASVVPLQSPSSASTAVRAKHNLFADPESDCAVCFREQLLLPVVAPCVKLLLLAQRELRAKVAAGRQQQALKDAATHFRQQLESTDGHSLLETDFDAWCAGVLSETEEVFFDAALTEKLAGLALSDKRALISAADEALQSTWETLAGQYRDALAALRHRQMEELGKRCVEIRAALEKKRLKLVESATQAVQGKAEATMADAEEQVQIVSSGLAEKLAKAMESLRGLPGLAQSADLLAKLELAQTELEAWLEEAATNLRTALGALVDSLEAVRKAKAEHEAELRRVQSERQEQRVHERVVYVQPSYYQPPSPYNSHFGFGGSSASYEPTPASETYRAPSHYGFGGSIPSYEPAPAPYVSPPAPRAPRTPSPPPQRHTYHEQQPRMTYQQFRSAHAGEFGRNRGAESKAWDEYKNGD